MPVTSISLAITGGLSAATAWVATPVLRTLGTQAGILDAPTGRGFHTVPTPRTGGAAILIGCAVGIVPFLFYDRQLAAILVAAVAMAAVGGADDVWGLSVPLRLGAQVIVAVTLSLGADLTLPLFDSPHFAIGLAAGALWLVGMTNGFNFMDGINGIATIQAIVAAGVLAVLAVRHDDVPAAIALAAILGGSLGFLPWNFPRGTIFMGDAGSWFLGLALAAMTLRVATTPAELAAALLPMLPFHLDVGATLLRRIWRRENILTPHRSHYYQRLVALGYSHIAVTMVWSALAVVGAAGALALEHVALSARMLIICVVLAAHVVIAFAITRRECSAGALSRAALGPESS